MLECLTSQQMKEIRSSGASFNEKRKCSILTKEYERQYALKQRKKRVMFEQ